MFIRFPAAFGRLCVETPIRISSPAIAITQPPSGGCVLKPCLIFHSFFQVCPAAFGRLCVETSHHPRLRGNCFPAAFGRLCVETSLSSPMRWTIVQPPSGGCVLKPMDSASDNPSFGPAAFGRLCVETLLRNTQFIWFASSRLRAAVC